MMEDYASYIANNQECNCKKNIHMSNFKERLEEELHDLSEKRSKLNAFIEGPMFNSVEPIQQSLLRVQAESMAVYEMCLTERIDWINSTPTEKKDD